jgi:hypothetical protein
LLDAVVAFVIAPGKILLPADHAAASAGSDPFEIAGWGLVQ